MTSTTADSRWTIRPAVTGDAEAIAQIYNYYVQAGGATFDATPWETAQVGEMLPPVAPEQWLVAWDQTGLLGWASARRFSVRYGYRLSLETAMYLDPNAIGGGVAAGLQQQLEDRCRNHQIHHAMARIIADNQRSLAFHYRHGYELVGIQKEVGFINGKWTDVAILQKILSS